MNQSNYINPTCNLFIDRYNIEFYGNGTFESKLDNNVESNEPESSFMQIKIKLDNDTYMCNYPLIGKTLGIRKNFYNRLLMDLTNCEVVHKENSIHLKLNQTGLLKKNPFNLESLEIVLQKI